MEKEKLMKYLDHKNLSLETYNSVLLGLRDPEERIFRLLDIIEDLDKNMNRIKYLVDKIKF